MSKSTVSLSERKIKYPKIGTVVPESPQYIRNSGKYAEDIVGLQK